MRKGVDFFLARMVRKNTVTGEIVSERTEWVRPPYGIKELRRRRAANAAAKQARKKNRRRR